MTIGDTCPDFCLPGTDGTTCSLDDYTDAAVLVVVAVGTLKLVQYRSALVKERTNEIYGIAMRYFEAAPGIPYQVARAVAQVKEESERPADQQQLAKQ